MAYQEDQYVGKQRSRLLSEVSYDYGDSYPEGIDLKPGRASENRHDLFVDMVKRRAQDSHRRMQRRFPEFDEIDKTLNVYIPADKAELKEKAKDTRKPISVVVPVTYALRETLLTHMSAEFLRFDDLFMYEPTDEGDTIGAKLLEMDVNYQAQRSKMSLALYTQWSDAFSYGVGVVAPSWQVRRGYQTRIVEEAGVDPETGEELAPVSRKVQEPIVRYEGHKLRNIHTRNWLPDPNVSAENFQDGEFVGWRERTNLQDLLSREREGEFFNVRYLKHIKGTSVLMHYERNVAQRQDPRNEIEPDKGYQYPVDVIHMYIMLSPKDYKLGDSEYPEMWYMAIAGDAVLLALEKVQLNHGMYPAALAAPDFDGYSVLPKSRLTISNGLQEVVNYLFNSHIASIRKVLHDMFIVDPRKINIYDILDPQGGRIIRTRRSSWGTGVKDGIEQLRVQDVTQQNIAEMPVVYDLMQRVTGASDAAQGIIPRRGERVSASEFQGALGATMNRLGTLAMLIYTQSHTDLADMLASQTQQFRSTGMQQRLFGRWAADLRKRLGGASSKYVEPEEILVGYDVSPANFNTRGGEHIETWKELFAIIGNNEMLAGKFDLIRIFKHLGYMMGARNMGDFELQPTVQDPEQVQEQVDRGNLVPIPGQGGGGQNVAGLNGGRS